MAGEGAFEVEGVVIEALPNGTYRVELPNGHQLLGFVTARDRQGFSGMEPGDKVKLKIWSYDLSQGRIVADNRRRK